MRCIKKNNLLRIFICLSATGLILSGCGKTSYELEQPFDFNQTGFSSEPVVYFADSLCVGEDRESGTEGMSVDMAEAAGIFCLTDKDIPCSKNIYERLYPASTTKILIT